MSISRIFSNGVSGLTAQSNALAVISDNVANASTVGYKRSEAQFSDVRLNDRFGNYFDGAGVSGSQRLLADRQGTATQTGVTTNAAIVGNGFFIVQDVDNAFGDRQASSAELTQAGNELELTRAGDFTADRYGHLVNSAGRALLAQRLDADTGTATEASENVADLELVSMNDMAGHYEGSTEVRLKASLPINQTVSASGDLTTTEPVKTVVTAVDNTGRPAAVGLSLIKTADDPVTGSTWEIYQTGVTHEDGTAAAGAPTTPTLLGSVSFGPGGVPIGGEEGGDADVAMSLGGDFGAVALNVGQYNRATGLAVTAADDTWTTSFSNSTDGIVADTMSDIEITSDGYLRANYLGGQSRDFYRIPNGFVRNAQGLDAISGTSFTATQDSGDIELKFFGGKATSTMLPEGYTDDRPTVGAALVANAVEQSNTEISEEFTTLIVAQRSYSASSKVITTADELTQTVLGLKN